MEGGGRDRGKEGERERERGREGGSCGSFRVHNTLLRWRKVGKKGGEEGKERKKERKREGLRKGGKHSHGKEAGGRERRKRYPPT